MSAAGAGVRARLLLLLPPREKRCQAGVGGLPVAGGRSSGARSPRRLMVQGFETSRKGRKESLKIIAALTDGYEFGWRVDVEDPNWSWEELTNANTSCLF
ncbi:hypothetical protein ACP70R_040652 [Stipagrostis hirtigluma subsp. patula]